MEEKLKALFSEYQRVMGIKEFPSALIRLGDVINEKDNLRLPKERRLYWDDLIKNEIANFSEWDAVIHKLSYDIGRANRVMPRSGNGIEEAVGILISIRLDLDSAERVFRAAKRDFKFSLSDFDDQLHEIYCEPVNQKVFRHDMKSYRKSYGDNFPFLHLEYWENYSSNSKK